MKSNISALAMCLSLACFQKRLYREKSFSFHDLNDTSQKTLLKNKTDLLIWGNGYINNTYVYLNFHPHRIKNYIPKQGSKTPSSPIDISFNEYISAVTDSDFSLYVFKEPKLNAEKDKSINNHSRNEVLRLAEGLKVIQTRFTKDKLFILTKDGKVYLYNLDIVHAKVDEFFATAIPDPEVTIDKTKITYIKELKNIVHISTGKDHFIALDNNGVVYGMGDDSFGQLGLENYTKEREFQMKMYNNFVERRERVPKLIKMPEKVKKIVCGENHTLALTVNGNIYGFGNNRFLQLSNDVLYRKQVIGLNKPTLINADKFKNFKVVDIAASKNCSFFICKNEDDGTFHFFSAGEGLRGTLGQNLIKHMSDVEEMPDISGLVNAQTLKPFEPLKLVCGSNHCLLLFKNPRMLYVWGNNEYGELGTMDRAFYESPVPILEEYNLPYKIFNISAGYKSSAFICEKVDVLKKKEILETDRKMFEEEQLKKKKKRRRQAHEKQEEAKSDTINTESYLNKIYNNIRKYI